MASLMQALTIAGITALATLAVGGDVTRGAALGTLLGLIRMWAKRPAYVSPPAKSGGVVVTGASSGIGKHAAEKLAALGFTVFAGVRKTSDGVPLKNAGCIPIILDVTSEEGVASAANEVRAKLNEKGVPLVAIVNNAGVGPSGVPIELEAVENMQWIFDCNVFGIVRMYKAFVPLLREGGGGRIINVGSVLGRFCPPGSGEGAYCMSKYAVEAITGCSRIELSKWGISVSVLNPGYVRTDLIVKAKAKKMQALEKLRAQHSEETHALYPKIFDKEWALKRHAKLEATFQKVPPPAKSTTPAIIHAITSSRPQSAYIVGSISPTGSFPSAKSWLFVKWLLPSPLFNALVMSGQKKNPKRRSGKKK